MDQIPFPDETPIIGHPDPEVWNDLLKQEAMKRRDRCRHHIGACGRKYLILN